MQSIRDIEYKPIIMDIDRMPTAHIDKRGQVLYKSSRHNVYVTMASLDNKQKQPVAVKYINSGIDVQELINAQILDRLGVGPKFYGIVKDDRQNPIGYVMQFVPGALVDALSVAGEKVSLINDRVFSVGLTPPTQLIHTPKGQFVAIDAGELQHRPIDEAFQMYDNFLKKCNDSDDAMIGLNDVSKKGGIDLNPAQMSMSVKKQGGDFRFEWNGQTFDAAQVTGATFTIRTMTPVTNLPQILGLNLEPANKPEQEILVKA